MLEGGGHWGRGQQESHKIDPRTCRNLSLSRQSTRQTLTSSYSSLAFSTGVFAVSDGTDEDDEANAPIGERGKSKRGEEVVLPPPPPVLWLVCPSLSRPMLSCSLPRRLFSFSWPGSRNLDQIVKLPLVERSNARAFLKLSLLIPSLIQYPRCLRVVSLSVRPPTESRAYGWRTTCPAAMLWRQPSNPIPTDCSVNEQNTGMMCPWTTLCACLLGLDFGFASSHSHSRSHSLTFFLAFFLTFSLTFFHFFSPSLILSHSLLFSHSLIPSYLPSFNFILTHSHSHLTLISLSSQSLILSLVLSHL